MSDCRHIQEGLCDVHDGEAGWHVAGCHYETVDDAFVEGVLGFCGCANPEYVARAMRDYLRLLADESCDFSAMTDRFPDELGMFVKYEADRVELTTHGGSVHGAWLAPKGTYWLMLLNTAPDLDG